MRLHFALKKMNFLTKMVCFWSSNHSNAWLLAEALYKMHHYSSQEKLELT